MLDNTHGKDSSAFRFRAVVQLSAWPFLLLNRKIATASSKDG